MKKSKTLTAEFLEMKRIEAAIQTAFADAFSFAKMPPAAEAAQILIELNGRVKALYAVQDAIELIRQRTSSPELPQMLDYLIEMTKEIRFGL